MNNITIDKTGWKKWRFDEFTQNISERVEPSQTDMDVYVGLEHIDPDTLHLSRHGPPSDEEGTKLRFYKGDVIFGRRRAYQRKTALATTDGICSAHAMVLHAKEEVVDPSFFPFLFHSKQFIDMAITISVGGLSPTINWKDISKQEFLLPPKSEQKRLAELLWAADEMIEKEKKELETLEELLEAYMYHNFNIPNCNAKLNDCITGIIGGGTPNTKKEECFCNSDGIPWITSISLEPIYISEGERFITTLGVKESAVNILPEGNVIIGTRVGVGKCSINNVAMCFSQDSTGIIINKDIVDPIYLLFNLRSVNCKKYFKSHSRGTTIQGITKEDLLKMPIFIPTMQMQLLVSEKCVNMVNSIDTTKGILQQSQKIKQELINQIF